MNITAHRWSGGWELHLNGEPITQVRTLAKAEQQVRDYLDTVEPEVDHSALPITVIPELGALGDKVAAAREATAAAAAAVGAAAKRSRATAQALHDAGFSVTDSAAILGVSRGRVSQLVHG